MLPIVKLFESYKRRDVGGHQRVKPFESYQEGYREIDELRKALYEMR
jgi:hypothetical protein